MVQTLVLSFATTALADRRLTFNGKPLSVEQQRLVAQLETRWGFRLPDGAYWYDARSGAAGAWGGPTLGLLPPGLRLPAPMPADCSGGGTGVFVNGREIHFLDVVALQGLFGTVMPGRYWLDATGNGGVEGGPPLFNLFVLAQQARAAGSRGGGAWSHRSSNAGGGSSYVGGDGNGYTYFFDSKGGSAYSK